MQHRRPWFNSQVGKIHWRRDRLPTPVFLGFPCGSADKEYTCNAGDLGLIPGLRRSPREGKGYPLQYSGLKNVSILAYGEKKKRKYKDKWNKAFFTLKVRTLWSKQNCLNIITKYCDGIPLGWILDIVIRA